MEDNLEQDDKLLPPHHIQQELCTTRPLYRQGRKLTAVKVYTINNESQHLLIYGVPKINLKNELTALCSKYGQLKNISAETEYKTEVFTECYHIQFERIQSSRIAKRFLDNKSFYGGILHVCYAPEFETIAETRQKLQQRQKDVLSRLEPGPTVSEYLNMQPDSVKPPLQNRKRKHPALPLTEKRLKYEDSDLIWKDIPSDIDPRLEGPKIKDTDKTGFKKHFQIPIIVPKGPEYGPYFPGEFNIISNDNSVPSTSKEPNEVVRTRTTLLPTTVIKNYKHACEKKIVFRNKEVDS